MSQAEHNLFRPIPLGTVTDDDPESATSNDLPASFMGIREPLTPGPSPVAAAATRLRGLFAAGRRTLARSPGHNPGHRVRVHNGGLFSASSSAPRNPRQQVNVAPPSHQRFDPSTHPAAMRAVLTVGPEMLELIE